MVFITLDYKGKSIQLEVNLEDTIEVLKYQIFSLLDVPPEQQFFKELPNAIDSESLFAVGIEADYKLTLVERPEVLQSTSPLMSLSQQSGEGFILQEDVKQWMTVCSKIFIDTPCEQPSYRCQDKIICFACAATCRLPEEVIARASSEEIVCQCSQISNRECLFAVRSNSNAEKVSGKLKALMLESMRNSNRQILERVRRAQNAIQLHRGSSLNKQIQFASRLEAGLQGVELYEDPLLQDKARRHVPVKELEEKAKKNPTDPSHGPKDEFIIQLLDWFKKSFFTWVNEPPCSVCRGTTKLLGRVPPNADEKMWLAVIVELYQCTQCQTQTRFPRYNHPEKLLETRRGRCGEFANCFTFICRSLGFDVRHVVDWTDHVWTEVYSEHKQRWVHCDACENKYDTPLLYEVGWGKKLSYVIAFSAEEVVDVTRRYTRKWQEVRTRRNEVSEEWLSTNLEHLNETKLRQISNTERRAFVLRRRLQEQKELESYEKETTPTQLKRGEDEGRISGSQDWKLQRGETGSKQPQPQDSVAMKNDSLMLSLTPPTTSYIPQVGLIFPFFISNSFVCNVLKVIVFETKRVPQRSMIVAEKSNYDLILNKLRQFNNELISQGVGLNDAQFEAVVKLVDILKDPSSYATTQVNEGMIDSLEFALLNWPLTKIFPVLDLLRLLLSHSDGSRKLCARSPFAKQTNVFIYILQFQNGLSANQMLMLRFFAKACALPECSNAIRTYFYQILDAVDPSMNNPQRGVRQNGAIFLINLAVFITQEKLSLSEQTRFCSLLLKLLETEKDNEIIFCFLVALGTIVSSS
jgi:hypothetical protein